MSKEVNSFRYGMDHLTVQKATAIASGKMHGVLSKEVREKVQHSEASVRAMVNAGKTVYGITTGFGILANTKISEEDTATLQYKILQSHSVGVGEPVPLEIVKLMLITKVHSLAQGYSGVQLSTL
jgi:histidine ammonia-lyase